MAKIWQISDGRSYVVNGDPGTTITYTNSTSNGTAAGKQAASIPAGATSVTFPSNGAEVEISSDTATIDQVFNAAAAGSGSSSGGSGSAGGVTFQIVTTLPNQGAAGVIYLVKVSETGDDKFEEWIWVESAWESIGTTAVDPTTYAKLIGGNTFEGNQVINGDLTVTGDVSGVTESNYNVVETAETTITPTGGTWVRYTGSETALTIEEPGWDGEAEISYIETATPVDLQGVTWNPAKPILTGNGPFVYTLVHTGPGQMLAGAYGYSVATAEAVQAVAPIAWGEYTDAPTCSASNSIVIGGGASTNAIFNVVIGDSAKTTHGGGSVSIGYGAQVINDHGICVGYLTNAEATSTVIGDMAWGLKSATTSIGAQARSYEQNSMSVGYKTSSRKPTAITIGAQFDETVNGQNVTHTCTTEGTGSITIGAGANTLNNGDTESSNSVTIGCKASNSGADSVVIGAQAKGWVAGSVFIGAGASSRDNDTHPNTALGSNAKASWNSVSVGQNSSAHMHSITVGKQSHAAGYSVVVGNNSLNDNSQYATVVGNNSTANIRAIALGYAAKANPVQTIAIGAGATISNTTNADNTVTPSENTTVIGYGTTASAPTALTFGAQFTETVDGQNVTHTCTTEGTGSITIGAGANTLNTTTTVDGVETTVESSNSITIGCKASNTGADSVVIGASGGNVGFANVVLGAGASAEKPQTSNAVAIGNGAKADGSGGNVALGADAYSVWRSVALGRGAKANAGHSVVIGPSAAGSSTGTIIVGSSATITNTGSTPSENTIVIGASATASAPNAVVLGAGASAITHAGIAIGANSSSKAGGIAIGNGTAVVGGTNVALGNGAKASLYATAIGQAAKAEYDGATSIGVAASSKAHSICIGNSSNANADWSIAIGGSATVSDYGATVIRSTASDTNTYTQLYFSGANTPLANTYEDGEAMMGYVVMHKGEDGQFAPVAAGTQKLSVLFPNNSGFQPATLGLDDEMTPPKVFHPSDLDLPVEEPTEEPEDVAITIPEPIIPEPEPYTPLPVYPIAEPEDVETDIPEQDPYTPLPVYPIVEPEIPEEPTE